MTSETKPEPLHGDIDYGPLAAINASEIDVQITTAKAYPRSLKEFTNSATEMVTLSEDVAGECLFALKRSGKTIEGPSARFAEIIASAWGNCGAGARVIAEEDKFVVAQGAFFDMQRNVRITMDVKRRITDKNGRRYNDDMIGVTTAAATSIALRNAVLKGVPKAFWQPIYLTARKTAVGDQTTLADRRRRMLEHFGKSGIEPETIFNYLDIKGEADITLDHLSILLGISSAIKNNEVEIDQAFAKEAETPKTKAPKDLDELADHLEGKFDDGTVDNRPWQERAQDAFDAATTEQDIIDAERNFDDGTDETMAVLVRMGAKRKKEIEAAEKPRGGRKQKTLPT